MRDEQLYVNDELLDIDNSTRVVLNYKSNLFRDVSKIVSNNTSTIKVPATVRNKAILQFESRTSGDGFVARDPRKEYSVRFVRNGVEVIRNGKLFVLKVTPTEIELSVVWGVMGALKGLIDDAVTLNDLNSNATIRYELNPTVGVSNGYGYIGYNSEVPAAMSDSAWNSGKREGTFDYVRQYRPEEKRNPSSLSGSTVRTNPVVMVSWLLERVRAQFGVGFSWPQSVKDYIDTLAIVLTERKANRLTYYEELEITFQAGQTYGELEFSLYAPGETNFDKVGRRLVARSDTKMYLKVAGYCRRTYSGGVSGSDGLPAYHDSASYIRVVLCNADGTEKSSFMCGSNADKKGYQYEGNTLYEAMIGEGTIEIKKGEQLHFDLVANASWYDFYFERGGGAWLITNSFSDVQYGQNLPIVYNLPRVKIIDLVKFLAAITGTFPLNVEGDVVSFEEMESLRDNVDDAYDWSERIIADGGMNQPRQLSYKVTDYAQHNIFKWKDDETVKGDYDGDLEVKNEQLTKKKTMYEFPFAASDTIIPIWVFKKVNGYTNEQGEYVGGGVSYEYQRVEPRVVRTDGETASFDINLQSVINTKYALLKESFKEVVVIKEKVAMSLVELMGFDETRPVYIAQYGHYYSVMEMKCDVNGVADVTLLQLKF